MTVTNLSMSISADGHVAGPDQSEEHPLGVGGLALHGWHRGPKQDHPVNRQVMSDMLEGVGATIMGRNMFGPIRGEWGNSDWKGWWGEVPPYHCPVFVLTHYRHDPIEMQGGTTFHELRRGERPISPDDDPFYRAPQGYEHAEPGMVLRSRDVEIGFLGVISQRVEATQLLYRTTNLHEEPEVAVTTVLVPAQRESDVAYPVLSYQCAIDAVASRCFPSFAMRRGARPIGAFVQAEYMLVTAALWSEAGGTHTGQFKRSHLCRGPQPVRIR